MLTIIFSNWSVNKIYNFLTDYLEADKIDIIYGKIERYKDENGDMKDTNKTLILMNPELYNKALTEGLDTEGDGLDFRIDQFHLSEKHLPKLHQSINFYIAIPEKISARDAEILICEKMNIIFTKIFIFSQINISASLAEIFSGIDI